LLKLIFNGRIHNLRNCYGTKEYNKYDDDNDAHDDYNNIDADQNKNNEDHIDNHKEMKFYCKGCDKSYVDEIKMLKHVHKVCTHEKTKQYRAVYYTYNIEVMHSKDTKEEMKMDMLNTFDMFYDNIKHNFYNDVYHDNGNKFIDFMKYFKGDILHEEYICKDIECATIIFDLLNNRGKKLENIDIIRNTIIRELDGDKKKEYYEKLADITKKNELAMFTKNKENYTKLLFATTIEKYETVDDIIKTCEKIFKDKNEIENNYNKI
jgi:hypothetical protein